MAQSIRQIAHLNTEQLHEEFHPPGRWVSEKFLIPLKNKVSISDQIKTSLLAKYIFILEISEKYQDDFVAIIFVYNKF